MSYLALRKEDEQWERSYNQRTEKIMNESNPNATPMVNVLEDAGLKSNPQMVNGVEQIATPVPQQVQMADSTEQLIAQVQAAVTTGQATVTRLKQELETAQAQLNGNTGALQLLQQIKQQGAGIFAPVQPTA